jgi:recombination protein RecT
MSNQVTVIGQICQALDKMESSFNDSLKNTGISADRFLTTAKTAIQTHADRDRLEKADRNSLYLAIKKSAGDGLMPDGREAALVVYGNQVQYQPMVQGLVKLARNSGEIESINAEVVFENDEFDLSYGIDGVSFKHAPRWTEERGQPVLVWATVKLKSGEVIARAYPKKRIDQIATRSKMSNNYDPNKGKDWEEFWRKAAIRNILKYAPKSTVLDKAMEAADREFQNEETFTIELEAKPTEKKETRAAAAVKGKKEESDTDKTEPEVIDADFTEVDTTAEAETAEEDLPI